jgi:hypothetical protein
MAYFSTLPGTIKENYAHVFKAIGNRAVSNSVSPVIITLQYEYNRGGAQLR